MKSFIFSTFSLNLDKMIRQNISIFFLTLAHMILLGHSILPHHHHDSLDNYSNHSKDCGHHHDNNHQSDWYHSENIFSLIPHGQEGLECIICPHLDQPIQKQFFIFESYLLVENEQQQNFLILKQDFLIYTTSFYAIKSELLPDSLRAPPSQV